MKHKKILFFATMTFVAVAVCGANAVADNLIINGGFADGLNGWTVFNGDGATSSIAANFNTSRDTDGDDYRLMMLSGNNANDGTNVYNNDHIYQTVSVTPGQTYQFSFDAARWSDHTRYLRVDLFDDILPADFLHATSPAMGNLLTEDVLLGNRYDGGNAPYALPSSVSFDTAHLYIGTDINYTTYSATFTAASDEVTLRFWDLAQSSDSFDIWLDNVQLTAAPVPEPSTMVLLLGCVVGACFLRRR